MRWFGSVSLPDSVTKIGMSALENCSNLGSVELPSELDLIGCWEFCPRLESFSSWKLALSENAHSKTPNSPTLRSQRSGRSGKASEDSKEILKRKWCPHEQGKGNAFIEGINKEGSYKLVFKAMCFMSAFELDRDSVDSLWAEISKRSVVLGI